MNQLVDFFIVGEPKSGTTALAQFLGEHAAVGIASPKEPHYFATDLQRESDAFHGVKNHHFPIRTAKQYAACFDKVRGKQMLGEGSTHYMLSAEAANNIKEYNPDAKIIVMLRNPVDFVHSLHMQYVNNGSEDEPDFATAISLESDRKRGINVPKGVRSPSHVFYSERVRYAEQLERYLQAFPADHIKVILMEEFTADNHKIYHEVLDFLELAKPTELPNFALVHGSKTPRFKRLHKLLNHRSVKYTTLKVVGANRYDDVKDSLAKLMLKRQSRSHLSSKLRNQLAADYKPEVERLAAVINRADLLELWGYHE